MVGLDTISCHQAVSFPAALRRDFIKGDLEEEIARMIY